MSERQTGEQRNASRLSSSMFGAVVTVSFILNLLIFAGTDSIPHWTLIVSYPTFMAFGLWAGFHWPGLSVSRFLTLGCILGLATFIFFEIGVFVFYRRVIDEGSVSSVYFDPFVRCGVAGALLFAGFAIVSSMISAKKFAVDKAFIAGAVALIGAIASLITAIKK